MRCKKLRDNAVLPFRATDGSAGYDLTATSLEIVNGIYRYGTGIAIEMPTGYFGALNARSSIYKTGLEKIGGTTIIDSDYRGEIFVLFRRVMGMYYEPYEVGDRIAQLIIQEHYMKPFEWSDVLSETARGAGGYGSTGR